MKEPQAEPNLFAYATSELSQDAMFCWWLAWANPKYATTHASFYELGQDFLRVCFQQNAEIYPSVITSVEVLRQHKKIDVLCVINKTLAVLIEDKVGTREHGNQLERYPELISDDYSDIVRVYIQTGDQSDYVKAKKLGYLVLQRTDLLRILESPNHRLALQSNNVFRDYAIHLRAVEDDFQSFKNSPIEEWSAAAWRGFYSQLQQVLCEGAWSYVANPSGGFWGFWWYWNSTNSAFDLYLQIEQGKLVFKVATAEKSERSSIRDAVSGLLRKEAANFPLTIHRPTRFGSGTYMTVAEVDGLFPRTGLTGHLDWSATLEIIQVAQRLIDRTAQTYLINSQKESL